MIASTMAAEFIENRTYGEIRGRRQRHARRARCAAQDITAVRGHVGRRQPGARRPRVRARRHASSEVIGARHVGRRADLDRARHRVPGAGHDLSSARPCASRRPVKVGDTITIKVTCQGEGRSRNARVTLDCRVHRTRTAASRRVRREAEVLAPAGKIKRERVEVDLPRGDDLRPTWKRASASSWRARSGAQCSRRSRRRSCRPADIRPRITGGARLVAARAPGILAPGAGRTPRSAMRRGRRSRGQDRSLQALPPWPTRRTRRAARQCARARAGARGRRPKVLVQGGPPDARSSSMPDRLGGRRACAACGASRTCST